MTASSDPEAVARGVYDAFLELLTSPGTGAYPISHEWLMDAVTEGVRKAFAEVLDKAIG